MSFNCFPSRLRIFHSIACVGTFGRDGVNTPRLYSNSIPPLSISRFWTMDIHRRKERQGQ